jgi:hypothetical protein
MLPNLVEVKRYLDVLTDSEDEVVTFQTFDDKKNDQNLARVFHLKKNFDDLNFLSKYQEQGCGVYFMVNKGDGQGRRAKNVIEVRALFIDLDGSPWEPVVAMLKPHVRVESSPDRWHVIWKVSDCSLEQFKPLQQAIAKKYNGDKSCCDLCRVLRLPGFFHMKTDTPFLTRLAEVDDFAPYSVQQIIDGLGLVSDEPATAATPARKLLAKPVPATRNPIEYTIPNTGEVINLAAWASKNPRFDILAAIAPDRVRGETRNGKRHIECPFAHEHADTSPDLATFVANASPPAHKAFDIHCMHAHCIDRDRLEFLGAMLEKGWLSEGLIHAPTPLQIKRPQKIYLPVTEIAMAHEWSFLTHDELRIALHLTTLAWSTDDGTLPDDDWTLARGLGLHEDQWRTYRETLTKAGWLIHEGGRLTNSIVKREYVNAQTALMKAISSGQRGGIANARKKLPGVV